jgi:methyltransferase (TIGR00027 family)
VLLGAGLDSFAYRSPRSHGLRVFEVDHPATQAWKRERLAATALRAADEIRFVAVDFTVDALIDRLTDLGFDRSQPAFVSWLGVTQYLTVDAIDATLEAIGRLCPGTELVMEYLVPAAMRDADGRALADFFMPRAAGFGEPWLTFSRRLTSPPRSQLTRWLSRTTWAEGTRSLRRCGRAPISFAHTSSAALPERSWTPMRAERAAAARLRSESLSGM